MTGLIERASKKPLAVILLVYLLVTAAYGIINPLFEAPDEHMHYFTVQTLSETWRLPVADDPVDGWMGQEAAQPPLYYLASAVLITPIDTSQAKEEIWFNPFTRLGDASSPANTNAFVHSVAESWPWQGWVLAAHVLRLFSAVIGLGTLLFIWRSARVVWPEKHNRAFLATALVAFLPQYNFLHASISNDPLVIFFCAATLWQLLRFWYEGTTTRRLLLLGVTIGLAMLSKMAGLLLLFYAIGFLAVLSWRQVKGLRPLLETAVKNILLAAVPALLLGGWLLVRNWLLYEDITAASVFIRVAGGDRQYNLGQVLGETSGLWRSLFGVFGWMNVALPPWLYLLWSALALLAVGGILLAVIRVIKRKSATAEPSFNLSLQSLLRPPFVLAVWVFVVYAGLVQFLLKTPAAQGRLMFPALVPLSLGMAYALSQWRNRSLVWVGPFFLLSVSLFSVLYVIPKAYEIPPLIEESAVPDDASRIERDMEQGLWLAAASIETETAAHHEWIWLTLYWTADAPPEEPPVYVLELFGRDTELLGKVQSYHGGGLFPAILWPQDKVMVDHVALRVEAAPDAPVAGRLNIKLEGEATSVDIGSVKILPASWPEAAGPPIAEAAGVAMTALNVSESAVSAGEIIDLTVQWQVLESPGRNLTTFVHLGEQDSPPLAQGDSPPLNGSYPTSLWAAGEVINDSYQLIIPPDLPDGRYPLYIGFYDPVGGERPVLTADGSQKLHNAYLVAWIEVSQKE